MYRQDDRFQIRTGSSTPYYDYVHRYSSKYKLRNEVKKDWNTSSHGNVACQTKKRNLKILLHNRDRIIKTDPEESTIAKHEKNRTDTAALHFYTLGQ